MPVSYEYAGAVQPPAPVAVHRLSAIFAYWTILGPEGLVQTGTREEEEEEKKVRDYSPCHRRRSSSGLVELQQSRDSCATHVEED